LGFEGIWKKIKNIGKHNQEIREIQGRGFEEQ
jgi:hypothetical protein